MSINDYDYSMLFTETFKYFSFGECYENYKIFENLFYTLVDDLQETGYRSFYYGRPKNDKVKILNYDMFCEINKTLEKFSLEKIKERRFFQNKLKNDNSDSTLDKYIKFESKMASLGCLLDQFKIIYSRYAAAYTYKLEPFDNYLDLKYRFFTKNMGARKNILEVKGIYIHDLEIKNLLSLMDNFEELKSLSNKIKNTYYNKQIAMEK